MRDEVKLYLSQLRQALPSTPPVSEAALKALRAGRDYEGMVQAVRKAMNVDVRLRVGWVNSGGVDGAPAWVSLPTKMPFYGTKAFSELTITMFFRKSFLEECGYDQIAIAIAHELSHVVLESLEHPLRSKEIAVDLTAMLLGFRKLYASGAYKEWRSENRISTQQLGYLQPDEVQFVEQLLSEEERQARVSEERLKRRKARPRRIAASLGALAVISGITALVALEGYPRWRIHKEMLAARARMRIPQQVDIGTKLVDVRVSFMTWTELYETTNSRDQLYLTLFERRARLGRCGGPDSAQTFRYGGAFVYEFREPSGMPLISGNPVKRFEISSCP
jgi:hypothetical protein